ncbi:MAG: DUF6624 domain-containing protein [Pyrinomonadaceae bacterium]
MRFALIFIFVSAAAAQTFNTPLRDELLKMREIDQTARAQCSKGNADEQLKCYAEISQTIDAPNTKRLEAIFAQYGFPKANLVGQEGVDAFMLMLQHAPDERLREKLLKPIKKAFKRGEITANEYSNYVDRLLVHQGKPQIYGSNFEIKDGKLVMSKTKDVKNLDKRRKKVGLPTIAEYVKLMKEIYNLEVVIPAPN